MVVKVTTSIIGASRWCAATGRIAACVRVRRRLAVTRLASGGHLGWGQGESRAAVKPRTGGNVLHLAANNQFTGADQVDLVGEL